MSRYILQWGGRKEESGLEFNKKLAEAAYNGLKSSMYSELLGKIL